MDWWRVAKWSNKLYMAFLKMIEAKLIDKLYWPQPATQQVGSSCRDTLLGIYLVRSERGLSISFYGVNSRCFTASFITLFSPESEERADIGWCLSTLWVCRWQFNDCGIRISAPHLSYCLGIEEWKAKKGDPSPCPLSNPLIPCLIQTLKLCTTL